MIQCYRADWLLPIAGEPVADGWVEIENGRILAVGTERRSDARDLGRVAVLPALVNAHTHLELSFLHGRVPPNGRFSEWIRALMALRRQYPDPSDREILDAARTGVRAARAGGTGLVGDVSNTLVTVPILREEGLPAHVFHELLGFNAPDPEGRVSAAQEQIAACGAGGDVRVSVAAHAPYSVSPPLFTALRTELARSGQRSSVHLGESPEESEFVREGTGPIRTILEELGVWTDEWRGVLPARTSPVHYLASLGFLERSTLVVHGVQFDRRDLSRLASLGVTIVSCPRSNRYVGVGSPPLDAFYAAGIPVAFGTDSLASVETLDMFSELREARRVAPAVPARRLLDSATRVGAEALGFGDQFGTIEAGKRAALIAVEVPAGAPDVEEYLVRGVPSARITWVDQQ